MSVMSDTAASPAGPRAAAAAVATADVVGAESAQLCDGSGMVGVASGLSFGKDTVDSVVGDIGSLSWITTLLGILWPRLNDSLADLIHEKVTPQLQHALPSPFKGAHFSRFSLGKGVPNYGEVEVSQRSDSHVQVEVDLSLNTDADILLELGVGGVCFGVRQVRFSGRLCIAMKPLLSKLPLVGAVQVFFASQPRIEMRFTGLAAIAEIPGLERKLHSAIEDLLRNSIVLPNAKTIQLAKDEQVPNLMEAYSQKAVGALRVRVERARNLAGTNWQMGLAESFSSDPYCVLRLGTSSTRTSTMRGSTNPEWPESEPAAYFPVYHLDQELEIEVHDENKGGFLSTKFVSFLGRMKACKVRNLLGPAVEAGCATHRIALDTSQVNSSMLHINDPVNRGVPSELDIVIEWANIVPEGALQRSPSLFAPPEEGRSDDLLMVELHVGAGFPEEGLEKGLRWRCSWDNQQDLPVTSMRGTPRTDKPNYEKLPSGLSKNAPLMEVISRLADRGESVQQIAPIVGFSPEVVLTFVKAKNEFDRRTKERQLRDSNCVEVQWHQTLPLAPPRSPEARLVVELLQGETVIGILDTFLLEERLREGRPIARQPSKLQPTSRPLSSGMGGLASWFFPECGKAPGAERTQAVTMEVSVRYQRFSRGAYIPCCASAPSQRSRSNSVCSTYRQSFSGELDSRGLADMAMPAVPSGSLHSGGAPNGSRRPSLAEAPSASLSSACATPERGSILGPRLGAASKPSPEMGDEPPRRGASPAASTAKTSPATGDQLILHNIEDEDDEPQALGPLRAPSLSPLAASEAFGSRFADAGDRFGASSAAVEAESPQRPLAAASPLSDKAADANAAVGRSRSRLKMAGA